ncbi:MULTISPECIES: response regulator [Niastella]|uniref:Response regulator n=1 Tax=Niastella soli TaxID=2821487 RepID=A0ABS3YVI5_9BACT|nr:response regulator [Niastella soli]MBO9201920.1 response regulator [Niastella soli]
MNFPKKVLLIDDDYEEYDIFTAALNECCKGVELVYEKNASSALIRMAKDTARTVPDMVVLDWRMPQISGREVLTRLRKLPQYSSVPIIIFTGLLDPTHLEDAKQLGATFFLEKPFDITHLIQKLTYLFSLDWKHIAAAGQQI